VNSALAALLRGNNTTISIAHRLSTIKRSDSIIVLGPDGRVAEQGTYEELSARPGGAFTKLMEWQLNGGETQPPVSPSLDPEVQEKPWEVRSEEGDNHESEKPR
jgi:putative ABC transport system ATP-binding protein